MAALRVVPCWASALGLLVLLGHPRHLARLNPASRPTAMTLKTRLIPCLDVKDGRVVKGVQFVDLRDAGDPVEAAIAYDAAGADELCFLDITASHENRDTIFDVVARTAEHCFMPVTVGGGIRKIEDIRKLLLAGADKVSINTAAVNDPDFVHAPPTSSATSASSSRSTRAGGRRGAPGQHNRDEWEIFTHGGRNPTGIDAVEFAAKMVERGAGELLVTSMDRDGTKAGFDLELTRAIADAVHVPVVASGGVGSLDDLVAGVREGHASAVLAASIFHFGTFTIGRGQGHLLKHGIAVRMDGLEAMTMTSMTLNLNARIAERAAASPDESYTAKLLAAGRRNVRARSSARKRSSW